MRLRGPRGRVSHEHQSALDIQANGSDDLRSYAYTEQGNGPVALFVHGVLLNGHLWRHQLAHLSDVRRCIAVDLLAHGDTEIGPDQDVSVDCECPHARRVSRCAID